MKNALFPVAVLCIVTASCSSSDNNGGDKDLGDAVVDDAAADTVHDSNDVSADTLPPDASGDSHGESAIENPFGFVMRLPGGERPVPCEDEKNFSAADSDWICTFEHGGTKGHIYVQATPKGCFNSGFPFPTYNSNGFLSVNGKATALSNVFYEFGGNHVNDQIDFVHGGKYYSYYHSSFAVGWRKCQPMDCLYVREQSGGAIVEDGCTSDRTLPVVCLEVTAERKAFAETDFADTFEKCPGDSQ